MKELKIKSLAEMEDFASKFLRDITSKKLNSDKAVVVGLFGDLGSGKTAFTQSVAKSLGLKQVITSPTFVIEKIYLLSKTSQEKFGFKQLIHIDAYRLESGKELLSLGWKKIINKQGNLILIEWPEKVKDTLPKNIQKLYFKFVNETTRKVTF
jgi:tRNA threonylcarbamoyladenosine biosynthesis protein TsaE